MVTEIQLLRMSVNQDSLTRLEMRTEMDKNFRNTKDSPQSIKNTIDDNAMQIEKLNTDVDNNSLQIQHIKNTSDGNVKQIQNLMADIDNNSLQIHHIKNTSDGNVIHIRNLMSDITNKSSQIRDLEVKLPGVERRLANCEEQMKGNICICEKSGVIHGFPRFQLCL